MLRKIAQFFIDVFLCWEHKLAPNLTSLSCKILQFWGTLSSYIFIA